MADNKTTTTFPDEWVPERDVSTGGVSWHAQGQGGGGSTGETIEPHPAHYIRKALKRLGMECDRDHPSIAKTPERFVRYLLEFMQPFDLEELLGEGFDPINKDSTGVHGMVIQTGIPFVALCEHHLLPMTGEASVAYIPRDKLLGLSKLTRLVYAYGHESPTLQEAITEKIADALFKTISSSGSMVVIRATHGCMSCRGVKAPTAVTTTSCVRGVFRDVVACREEFLSLAK
jgi:GTP cyclohydrolase I